mmetsp:Transcript_81041/g.229466  ORF Transcript_81041/g.229466 Transcript_81041/m.229466 type:complete len:296 (-) Transcript_81041:650-1537(-)
MKLSWPQLMYTIAWRPSDLRIAAASHSPPRGPDWPTARQSRARPRRGGSRTSTLAGPPSPSDLPPGAESRRRASSALSARKRAAPRSTRRALTRNASALPGFRSVLRRATRREGSRALAACARLRPMTPTPPQSSRILNGSMPASPLVWLAEMWQTAAFMSQSSRSKTPRLACWKLAGPKENRRPSRVSTTSDESTPDTLKGQTCSHAFGFFECMARCREKSGSRQCTHIECHFREGPPSLPGHSASTREFNAGSGSPRFPFQTSTSCTRRVDLSTVNSTCRSAPSFRFQGSAAL